MITILVAILLLFVVMFTQDRSMLKLCFVLLCVNALLTIVEFWLIWQTLS